MRLTRLSKHFGRTEDRHQRTYHAFDFDKYGFLDLAEAQYRFNRRFDMAGIFKRLLSAAAATSSRTEAWMRLAEDQR